MFFDILFFFFFVSCINYHLQFEEVGSPAAGEAMEEQVNAERTETERASHSQHAEAVRGESSAGTTLGDISLLDRSMYYWLLLFRLLLSSTSILMLHSLLYSHHWMLLM